MMKQLIEDIAKALVDIPEEVSVREVPVVCCQKSLSGEQGRARRPDTMTDSCPKFSV